MQPEPTLSELHKRHTQRTDKRLKELEVLLCEMCNMVTDLKMELELERADKDLANLPMDGS